MIADWLNKRGMIARGVNFCLSTKHLLVDELGSFRFEPKKINYSGTDDAPKFIYSLRKKEFTLKRSLILRQNVLNGV